MRYLLCDAERGIASVSEAMLERPNIASFYKPLWFVISFFMFRRSQVGCLYFYGDLGQKARKTRVLARFYEKNVNFCEFCANPIFYANWTHFLKDCIEKPEKSLIFVTFQKLCYLGPKSFGKL